MSCKSPGYRQVEWTSDWEHPLEFWLVRNSPIIANPQANIDRDHQRQIEAVKRDERARESLRHTTALFGEPVRQRLCPCGCGVTLMRGMVRHPEMDVDYEEQWEFTHMCARGEIPTSVLGETEEPKPAKIWPQAVSRLQIEWAKRQLDILNAGGTVNMPREALEALANTSPEGLPYRVADLREPVKSTVKPGKAKRTVNKR